MTQARPTKASRATRPHRSDTQLLQAHHTNKDFEQFWLNDTSNLRLTKFKSILKLFSLYLTFKYILNKFPHR